FVALKTLEFKTPSFKPKDIDVLFTAISAVTVSSMSTLDMEVFSNTQLIVLMFLMFMGGEIFVSMLGLQFRKFKIKSRMINLGSNSNSDSTVRSLECTIELGVNSNDLEPTQSKSFDQKYLMHEAIKSLGNVVLCYILVVHFIGYILTYMYITFSPSSKSILINKGLSRNTFSLFTTVSTFANCGFIPTNENMMVFKKHSGLLLILIGQILLGSTLYPVVLQAVILLLEKITKRVELGHMLKYSKEMNYDQLLPKVQSLYLGMTVFGLILVQFIVFCCLEWHNMDGLDGYEKVVGSIFQVVNTRYAGETVFDLSKVSPAILLGFIVMMYLPSSTTYLPVQDQENSQRSDQKKSFVECFLFSQLSYLIMFTISVCLTERKKMEVDPINFSVINIAFEVFSAYGNVGLSTGYSCQHQIKPDEHCKDELYGFVGRWSNNGKCLLILVMFFGRLKNFNKNGGRFWKLS
ncbi:sodium transporter HKT1-like, partial [Cynara cardunculus var. scolymus]|uniref:sodium transporter HKT1-like n=1 Tax=Cynara cardunculus var. scolymus TaxID=59895 RepID=UPI000D6243E4